MTEKQLREQLDAVYASSSWRITAPFRFFSTLLKTGRFRIGSPKRLIFSLLHWSARKPSLRYWGQRLLRRFPKLERRVRHFVLSGNSVTQNLSSPHISLASEEHALTPTARAILAELRKTIHYTK